MQFDVPLEAIIPFPVKKPTAPETPTSAAPMGNRNLETTGRATLANSEMALASSEPAPTVSRDARPKASMKRSSFCL